MKTGEQNNNLKHISFYHMKVLIYGTYGIVSII